MINLSRVTRYAGYTVEHVTVLIERVCRANYDDKHCDDLIIDEGFDEYREGNIKRIEQALEDCVRLAQFDNAVCSRWLNDDEYRELIADTLDYNPSDSDVRLFASLVILGE